MGKAGNNRVRILIYLLVFLVAVVVALAIAVGILAQDLDTEQGRREDLEAALRNLQNEKDDPSSRPVTPTLSPETTTDPGVSVLLPVKVAPYLYHIQLFPDVYDPDNEDNFTLIGYIKIHVTCKHPTRTITLHGRGLNISESSVQFALLGDVGGHVPEFESHSRDESLDFSVFHLTEELIAGQNYTLDMAYTAKIATNGLGLFWTKYDQDGETRYVVCTQNQPYFGRRYFPSFDEPEIKAQYDVQIIRRSDYMTLANMPQSTSDEHPQRPGYTIDKFQRSPVMSTYLLAIVVAYDYRNITMETDRGIPMTSWTRRDLYNDSRYGLTVAVQAMETYEKYMGIDYNLPKSDQVALPRFVYFNGMENWGIIKYRETSFLHNEDMDTTDHKYKVASLVRHELAHMWFGNLVTCKWWSEIWLHEAYASFFEYLAHNAANPEWKSFDMTFKDFQGAFSLDDFPKSRSLVAEAWRDLDKMFHAITYNKGSSLVRQLYFILGEETFQKAMQRYIRDNIYKNAETSDMWKAISDQLAADGRQDEPFVDRMNTWVYQNNYPVVTITRETNGSLTLTQQRFIKDQNLLINDTTVSPYGYRWHIPFTFTSSNEMGFNKTFEDIIWMDPSEENVVIGNHRGINIPLPSQVNSWVIGNPGVTSLYRVNYDSITWESLSQQLIRKNQVIDARNRAQLLDDSWNLAEAGMLEIEKALNIYSYLGNETDYIPWDTANKKLSFVDLLLRFTLDSQVVNNFIASKAGGALDIIGYNISGSSFQESLTRSILVELACIHGHPGCIQWALDIFQSWKDNETTIEPDFQKAVFCTAVKLNRDAWDSIFNEYTLTSHEATRHRLISGLSCTQDLTTIQRFLDKILNSDSLKPDAVFAIKELSKNPAARYEVKNAVFQDWNKISEDYRSNVGYSILPDILISYNTEYWKKKFESTMTSPSMSSEFQFYLRKALNDMDTRIKWMTAFQTKVVNWMTNELKN